MPVYNVRNFEIVNTSMYINGEIFVNEKDQVGMLVNGKIEKMIFESDLQKVYVKKTDVSKMIDSALKKVTKDAT